MSREELSTLHHETIGRLLLAIFPDRADWTLVARSHHLGRRGVSSRRRSSDPTSMRNAVFRALYRNDGDLITSYLFDEILVSVKVAPLREYRCVEERWSIGSWRRSRRFQLSKDEVASFTDEVSLALRSILTNIRYGGGRGGGRSTVVRFSQRYWSHSVNSLVSILELMCVKFTLTFDDRLPCVAPQTTMLSLRLSDFHRPRTLAGWCFIRWKFVLLRRRRCIDAAAPSPLRCVRCARYIFVQLRYVLRTVAYRMLANAQIILSSKFIRLYVRTMRQCDTRFRCDVCDDDGDDRFDDNATDIRIDLEHSMIGGACTVDERDVEFTRHPEIPDFSLYRSAFSTIDQFPRQVAHLLPMSGSRAIMYVNELNPPPLHVLPVLMFSMFGGGQEKYKLTISYDRAKSIVKSRRIGFADQTLGDYVPLRQQ